MAIARAHHLQEKLLCLETKVVLKSRIFFFFEAFLFKQDLLYALALL